MKKRLLLGLLILIIITGCQSRHTKKIVDQASDELNIETSKAVQSPAVEEEPIIEDFIVKSETGNITNEETNDPFDESNNLNSNSNPTENLIINNASSSTDDASNETIIVTSQLPEGESKNAEILTQLDQLLSATLNSLSDLDTDGVTEAELTTEGDTQ